MGLFSDDRPKFTVMDTVNKILDETKVYEKNSFEDILNIIYASNYWFRGVEAYAAYVYLMIKNYFYDPHICFELRKCIWNMKKDEKYNTRNVERDLINKYKEEFEKYDFQKLKEIYKRYLMQEPSVYIYKDSRFYFTYEKEKLSNHYAYIASVELLNEKYGTAIEPVDLSENNNDDFRKIRSDERVKLAEGIALKTVYSVIKKHVPDDWKEENF